MKSTSSGPLAGIFSKPPEVLADILASGQLFSGGPEGGLRVLTVYIAYAGKRLSAAQRQSLEKTKEMLLDRTRETSSHRYQDACLPRI